MMRLAAVALLASLVGPFSCRAWDTPLQEKVGVVGGPGALDAVYKVDDTAPDRWLQDIRSGGRADSALELVLPADGGCDADGRPTTVGGVVCLDRAAGLLRTRLLEIHQPEADRFLYVYRSDQTVPLGFADGLVAGRVDRTIPAGREITVDGATDDILAMDGPPDRFTVQSETAELQLAHRRITLPRGEYSAVVLDPLWGRWSEVRVLGAFLTIFGGILLVASVVLYVPDGSSSGGSRRRRFRFFWTISTVLLLVGIAVFILDHRLIPGL